MFAGLIIGAALIAASALLRMRASAWVSLLAAMVAYSESSDALVALATGTALRPCIHFSSPPLPTPLTHIVWGGVGSGGGLSHGFTG